MSTPSSNRSTFRRSVIAGVTVVLLTAQPGCADGGGGPTAPPPAPLAITSIEPSVGDTKGGTVVTLTGANFGPAAIVTFGGLPATDVHVINGTTLTAVTPAHVAGKVDVRVESTGRSITSRAGYDYAPIGNGDPDDDPCYGCWDY